MSAVACGYIGGFVFALGVWQSALGISPPTTYCTTPPRAADPIRCCCCWLRWLPSSLLPLSLVCMYIIPVRFTRTAAVYFRTREGWFPTYESICFFHSSWLFCFKEALFALDLSAACLIHDDYLITPSVCVVFILYEKLQNEDTILQLTLMRVRFTPQSFA